jgi:hypothetical protein
VLKRLERCEGSSRANFAEALDLTENAMTFKQALRTVVLAAFVASSPALGRGIHLIPDNVVSALNRMGATVTQPGSGHAGPGTVTYGGTTYTLYWSPSGRLMLKDPYNWPEAKAHAESYGDTVLLHINDTLGRFLVGGH